MAASPMSRGRAAPTSAMAAPGSSPSTSRHPYEEALLKRSRAHALLEVENGHHRAALVCARHEDEQRARSRTARLYEAQPARHCAVAEALRRPQQTPQERAVSLGDVDAELPYQPRRQRPFEIAARCAGTSK